MGIGEWGMGNGEWGIGSGEWGIGIGKRIGEWGLGNGDWGMGSGEWEEKFFLPCTLHPAPCPPASSPLHPAPVPPASSPLHPAPCPPASSPLLPKPRLVCKLHLALLKVSDERVLNGRGLGRLDDERSQLMLRELSRRRAFRRYEHLELHQYLCDTPP